MKTKKVIKICSLPPGLKRSMEGCEPHRSQAGAAAMLPEPC
jgi:hypothetical protein